MKNTPLKIFVLTTISIILHSLTIDALAIQGCAGVGNNGDYAKKLQERKGKGGQKTVGNDYKKQLTSMKDGMKRRLDACRAGVGQDGIPTGTFSLIESRLDKAINTHGQYVQQSGEICQKYEKFTNDNEADTKNTAGIESTTKESFTHSAQVYRNMSGRFGSLHRDAQESGNTIEKGMPRLERESDPIMDAYIDGFKNDLTKRTNFLKAEARKKLANRSEYNESSGEEKVNKIRFKTQADVDKFYRGLDECDAAARDLTKFKEKYKKLAGDLGEAKQEAQDATRNFQENSDNAANLASKEQAAAKSVGDNSSANSSVSGGSSGSSSSPENSSTKASTAGGHSTSLSSENQAMLDRGNAISSNTRYYNSYNQAQGDPIQIAQPGTAGSRGATITYQKYCNSLGSCILKPQ